MYLSRTSFTQLAAAKLHRKQFLWLSHRHELMEWPCLPVRCFHFHWLAMMFVDTTQYARADEAYSECWASLFYPILRLMQAQSISGSGASGPVHHAFNNYCFGVRQFQEGRKNRRTKATSEGGKGRKQRREWKEGRKEGVGSLRYSPNVG